MSDSRSLKIDRPPDLRDQAYARLRLAIMDGRMAQGTRVTEAWAARELGISRTPAREALVMLTQDGLIAVDQRGFLIPRPTEAEIRNVYQMRLLVEPPAVHWICSNVPKSALASLCEFADREMDLHETADTYAYMEMVKRLRERLFSLLANETWRETIARFEAQARIRRFRTMQKPDVRRISMAGNRELCRWLALAHADGAQAAMTLLLTSACQTTLDAMADSEE